MLLMYCRGQQYIDSVQFTVPETGQMKKKKTEEETLLRSLASYCW